MKIICVNGVTCSGKSTHCVALADELEKLDIPEGSAFKGRPFVLSPGMIFRRFFGPGFFETLADPIAPQATEAWVRSLVSKAVEQAYLYKRSLILDGFPRTKEQVQWLLNSCIATTHPYNAEFHFQFLFPNEDQINERITMRSANPGEDLGLLKKRLATDVHKVIAVQQEINRYKATGNYNNIKEVLSIE